jgi:hypothetical protein
MNNSAFQVNDELIVEKGREGMVNARYWANTGRFWARGTNTKSRTSASRGTHKVFKSKAPELAKAEKGRMKGEVNALANRMLAANFGTHLQYKMGPNGKMVQLRVPEYEHYNNATRAALAAAGIRNRPRAGPGAAAGVPNNNNDLTGMMGKMGIGRGGKKTRQARRSYRSYRKTRRN